MLLRYLFVVFAFFSVFLTHAQLKNLKYDTEIGSGFASNQQIPFWLRTNQYGIVPLQSPFFSLRTGLGRDYAPKLDSITKKSKRFDWGIHASSVLNLVPTIDKKTQVLWPEVYLKIKLGIFELYGGKRQELVGLGDSTLSSGFVAWSGNALPFPKIQLQTLDFVPVKFIKSIVSFKASYAHGWFTVPYIEGAYLHQKTLYMRFGKPHWPVQFYAGLNHQVQWGGHADYLIGSSVAENGRLPTSFRDYVSLVTGQYPDDYANSRYNSFDGANRIGNHLGSYDFALEWRSSKRHILLYHQHPYEDASGLAFQNFPDGLTGIRIVRHSQNPSAKMRLKRLVVEYLNTTDQSGEAYNIASQYQGGDSYFNHGQYTEGWSYFKNTIGTPFIAPYSTFRNGLNTFANNVFFPNNRVIMGYFGSEWVVFKQVTLFTRTSLSQNLGSFGLAYARPPTQFSFLLSAHIPVPQWAGLCINSSFSFDQGQLFSNTFGGYFGLKKMW